ncbi:MAG: MotA/TolQ/ExbB proton channel family protein [Gemmatimonadota bacterium]|jgi:biopolymer transport protein ExbB/TolQ
MIDFFRQGGPFMWPLLLVAVAVAVLAVRSVLRMRGPESQDVRLETGIDAILFWGAWGVVLGLLGTLGGVYQAAGAISRAADISVPVVWGGIRVALTTTIFGLLVFAVAAVVWFALRVRYRRRTAS